MRRLNLAAQIPSYEAAVELAKGIRLFDKNAIVAIREGKNCDALWEFRAQFSLDHAAIRYNDLRTLFKNSVESSGGKLLMA